MTGVEARFQNYSRCEYVANRFPQLGNPAVHPRRRSAVSPSAASLTRCSVLACCTTLDEPDAFLKMLGGVTRKLLIIQSHFSLAPTATHEGAPWPLAGTPTSPMPVTRGACMGTRGHRSGWLSRNALLAAIRDAGFGLVFRQFDYLDDITAGPSGVSGPSNPCGGVDRGMFVGIKL